MSRNQPVQSSETMQCKAIDASGCLGSLYDKRKDRLLRGCTERILRGSYTSLKSSDCAITQGSTDTDFNLLQFIGVEDEIRLTLLLNVAKRVGITSVMNYSHRIDESTRILYYSYVDRREEVVNIEDVSKMLESADHQRIATHVITAINFGIDLVAILRLPSNVDTVANIDNILQKMCLFLRHDGDCSAMTLNDEDVHLLDKNTSITVYSNIPFFIYLTRISDILHYVAQHKNSNLCRPINYYLHQTRQLHPRSGTPSLLAISQSPVLPVPSESRTDQMINILLLGETGVGKSTFINAFVNYLSFDTFEQAESNKPVVLIPVSFLMTVGDNFEERTVKFGDVEGLKNEDFSHPGQSVTQHCKSYIFHLDDGKKLCIIDTPGFGDTRGLEQDDQNMQNILEYIDNLSHLNAICFLLKPNSSRLNIFRTCLTQILDLLGPKICKNLTFCFTNARSTFYTPGDSGPLLKNMLKSLPTEDIPFRKENTFCFDNKSFRYVVALRARIAFDAASKREYAMSWSTSAKESNRLIDYIRTKPVLHSQKSDWQSMKHAQFEITYMIRPILEAMRNILRNTILQNTGSVDKQIVLNPIVIHRSVFLCLVCKEKTTVIGKFWIVQDWPHEIQGACLNCPCTSDQHIRIDYILDYELKDTSSNSQNKTDDTINLLCQAGAAFAYFLIHIAHSTHDDPFDSSLMRVIIQESELSDHHRSDNLNSQLTKELRELHAQYEQNIKRMESNQERMPLEYIYGLMNDIRQLPIIETQMNAVRWGREILMKQHENQHQEI